jgi:alkylhydroperoxidase/carboxymuconolactone decarboxylase family protein YurZ
MDQTVRFQETLRRLAMIDEAFVEDEARLGLDPARASALDPKTVALLQVGASVALGPSAVCLEWSTSRALAAGASEDEIADVVLAITPVAGLSQLPGPAKNGDAQQRARDIMLPEHPADHLPGHHQIIRAPVIPCRRRSAPGTRR